MPQYTRAMEAVDNNLQFGAWTVLRHSASSGVRVVAVCGDCKREQEVNIHELRRSRKRALGGHTSCRGCANRMKRRTFARLPPGERLLNTFEHEYRKTAADRGLPFELDKLTFRLLVYSDCTYCGSPPAQTRSCRWDTITINGIDRVDSHLGYTSENCVPCCKTCNYMKRSLSREDFIRHVHKIVEHTG